ncbi:MAG: hypothetical protein Ta2E_02880 [Mycoplasmoidaceae bacterium]|nr:MAG: hypothetical protein Ta2E_02880 [Mycoplasmoidaceae bacterium]
MKRVYLLTSDNHGDYDSFLKIVKQVKVDYKNCEIRIYNLGDYNNWKDNKFLSRDGHDYVGYIDINGKEYFKNFKNQEALDGNHFIGKVCVDTVIDKDSSIKNAPADKLEKIFNKKYVNLKETDLIKSLCDYKIITTGNKTKIVLFHEPMYKLDPTWYDTYTYFGYGGEKSRLKHVAYINKILTKEKPTYIVGAHQHDPSVLESSDKNNWFKYKLYILGSANPDAKRESKKNDINYAIIDDNGNYTAKILK